MIITEKLLFAVHQGTYCGHQAGIIMENHCLPLACSHVSDQSQRWKNAPVAEFGFQALWESVDDVEEFFDLHLGFPGGYLESAFETGPSGLFVYEVEYSTDQVVEDADPDDEDYWQHLRGGIERRPTPEELEPLTRGHAPWGGVVL